MSASLLPSRRRRIRRCSRRCSGASSRAVPEHPTISELGLNQEPTGISIPKWIDLDGDFVSGLEILEFPPTLHDDARAPHLDAPVFDPPTLLRHIDLNVGMRIGPLECRNRACQSDPLPCV